jgi:hypothetical protein
MVDRRKTSFREAEGASEYPALLAWGQIDRRVRAAIWNAIYLFFEEYIPVADYGRMYINGDIQALLRHEYIFRQHGHLDVFDENIEGDRDDYVAGWKNFFMVAEYVELFDCLQFLMRDPHCPDDLIDSIEFALNEPYSPYRLVRDPPTIIPAVSSEEANQLKSELDEAFTSPFEGAKTHLRKALAGLNAGEERAAIREAIHAVESAVRDVAGTPKATLSDIFRRNSGVADVHPALRAAFEKLYAYTSDESGIRHALIDEGNEKVGSPEAIFFVSACTAFVGYLSRKELIDRKV